MTIDARRTLFPATAALLLAVALACTRDAPSGPSGRPTDGGAGRGDQSPAGTGIGGTGGGGSGGDGVRANGGSGGGTGGSAGGGSGVGGGTGGGSGVGGGTSGQSGAGGGAGGAVDACVDWSPCDDGNPSTTGDVCVAGACVGATAAEPLVVHEWGTFTSVKASDGHTLGGVHHIDEALPKWVHQRVGEQPWGYHIEGIPDEPLQQLETPVLYFHSGVPRAVHVDIAFPLGVVGEWYPVATTFSPPVGSVTAIAGGKMSWDLTLDPAIAAATFAPVVPTEIWAPSRNVACAPVRAANDEREQFVFYRGLGKFEPPLVVSAPSDQHLHLANLGQQLVPASFLLVVTGKTGGFLSIGPLPVGATMDTVIPTPSTSIDEMIAIARSALRTALEATGLSPDEALAMVDTWTRSWLHADGVRVLYLAPREWTDGWLPTTISPPPAELVRTLVGRVEVLRPSEEADLVKRLTDAVAMGKAPDLGSLGRFAEPRLFRAVEQLNDGAVKSYAEALRQGAHALPSK